MYISLVGLICIAFIQTWCLAFTLNSFIFVSSDQRICFFSPSGDFLPTLGRIPCAITLPFGLIGGLQQRWLFFWKVLLSSQRNSKSITERRFRWLTGSRKFWWFWTYSTNWWSRPLCSLLLSKQQKSFPQASPDLYLFDNPVWEFDKQFRWLCAEYVGRHSLVSTVGAYIARCVSFWIMSAELTMWTEM